MTQRWLWEINPLSDYARGDQRWPSSEEYWKPSHIYDMTELVQRPPHAWDIFTGQSHGTTQTRVVRRYYMPTDDDFDLLKRLYPKGDPQRPSWIQIRADLINDGHSRDELEIAEATLVMNWLRKMKSAATGAATTTGYREMTVSEAATLAGCQAGSISRAVESSRLASNGKTDADRRVIVDGKLGLLEWIIGRLTRSKRAGEADQSDALKPTTRLTWKCKGCGATADDDGEPCRCGKNTWEPVRKKPPAH